MKPVLFRADGSSGMGMGHVVRCLALAGGLKAQGLEPGFVTKALDPRVTEVIRSEGYETVEIPSATDWNEDVRLTLEAASIWDSRIIITDLGHKEALEDRSRLKQFHRSVSAEYFTLSLAGDNCIDMPSTMVVNPYVGATPNGQGVDGPTILLLGPKYFIFRPEFIAAAGCDRSISLQGARVLVLVGGGDELGLTKKIVKSVCALDRKDIELRVVFGPAYPNELKAQVQQVLEGFQGEHRLLSNSDSMSEAMMWADLAITGDGLTKYETAVTGTPSITLSRFDSHQKMNQDFANAGSTVYLGDGQSIPESELTEQIRVLLADSALRGSLSEKGKQLLDGKGLERVMASIRKEANV